MQPATIGIVGLGLVGQALGQRLRAAGWRTLGHDLRPEAVQAFEDAGGEGAGSLPALGRSVDTVVLAVFDTHGALQVLEGEPGLLGPGSRVGLVIDCSTGSPDQLVALGRRLHARGIDLVEAPLSGSSQQIGEGEATALVGDHGEGRALRGRHLQHPLGRRRGTGHTAVRGRTQDAPAGRLNAARSHARPSAARRS